MYSREEKGLLVGEARRCEEGEWKKGKREVMGERVEGSETGWVGAGSKETL